MTHYLVPRNDLLIDRLPTSPSSFMCLCHTAQSRNVVTCARPTLGCQPPTRIKHAQCKPTGAQCLLFQLRNMCTTIVRLNLQWRTNSAVVLVAYNQPSNRAPPCLVPGYRDTSKWVTAEKDRVTRVSNGLSVVIQIRDLTLSKSCIKLVNCVQAVHDLTLSNHRVKLVKYIQMVHGLTRPRIMQSWLSMIYMFKLT